MRICPDFTATCRLFWYWYVFDGMLGKFLLVLTFTLLQLLTAIIIRYGLMEASDSTVNDVHAVSRTILIFLLAVLMTVWMGINFLGDKDDFSLNQRLKFSLFVSGILILSFLQFYPYFDTFVDGFILRGLFIIRRHFRLLDDFTLDSTTFLFAYWMDWHRHFWRREWLVSTTPNSWPGSDSISSQQPTHMRGSYRKCICKRFDVISPKSCVICHFF